MCNVCKKVKATEPVGLSAHEARKIEAEVAGAVKFDQGKPMMELLPLPALEEIAKVLTFGAQKYAPNGWKALPDAENRYLGAMLRHLAAIQKGETIDPDSGLPHINHVACNAMFLTHFELEKVKEIK